VKLSIGNSFTHAEFSDELERLWLDDFLRFDDSSNAWRGGKYKHSASSQRSLLDASGTFPAGLSRLVIGHARKSGYAVDVHVTSKPPVTRSALADLRWLRPHQLRAVDAVCTRTRGVLELPTGAGKTEIAIALHRALPCRWLFLVHRDVLRQQTVERFDKRAAEHGLVERALLWDSSVRSPWSHSTFVVASYQGINAALRNNRAAYDSLIDGVQAVNCDEAHTLPSDTFYRVVMDCTGAYYRVALSATAFKRGDRRSVMLLGAVGNSIMKLLPQELIDAGLLVQPRVEFWPHIQLAKFRKWDKVRSEQIVNSESRNELISRITANADKPALVFVQQIDHATVLSKLLAKRGVTNSIVTGKETTSTRVAALKQLERGDIDVIVCTVVFQEGVDLPSIASIINASGGKSQIAAVQRAGRALRPSPGKTSCAIHDVDDRGVPMLQRHAQQRRAAYLEQGYPVATSDLVSYADDVPRNGPTRPIRAR